jgi:hypothetical protein
MVEWSLKFCVNTEFFPDADLSPDETDTFQFFSIVNLRANMRDIFEP